jgi:type IV secretion system protein VirB10
MSLWRRSASPGDTHPNDGSTGPAERTADTPQDREESPGVAGERGVPPGQAFKSVQSRVSSALTVALMVVLSAGLLIWYYSSAIGRSAKARSAAVTEQQRRAQGDSTLPPLGSFHLPSSAVPASRSRETTSHEVNSDSPLERILGSAPEAPTEAPEIPLATENPYATPVNGAPPPKTPAQLALDRRLAGPVLTHTPGEASPSAAGGGEEMGGLSMQMGPPGTATPASPGRSEAEAHAAPSLESLLHATATPAVTARVLPTQRYLLPKGAFIDCTLETAISSSLPGMTTCVTATDTFSADGTVVLLERGTKLVGETRGVVQAGSPRLFVLWNEARTPAGIVVPLASPGTDELGRSGLSGSIDWHWAQRFGAAILVTIIDGVVQAAADRTNSTTVQLNPSGASDVMTEILRNTLAVPPTINKPQGDRIEIFVARDVDFRSVYVLRSQSMGGP